MNDLTSHPRELTCEQFRAMWENNRTATLAPADAQAVDLHYDQCAACKAEINRPAEIVDVGEALADKAAEEASWKRLVGAPPEGDPECLGVLRPGNGPHWRMFRVRRELGRGGMAEVLLAQEEVPKRSVAIKLPTASLLQRSPEARDLVKKEAEALGKITDHSHVVELYSYDETKEHHPYLVMEFVQGQTLDERIDGRPLPVPLILDLSIQIANGLRAAHAPNVYHRDLKPRNILLFEDEGKLVAKITDFGLAWRLDKPGEKGTWCAGTPAYMAPEQIDGKEPTPRVDLYSLGVVLYEMCTGTVPYAANSMSEIRELIRCGGYRPVREVNREIPPTLAALVEKLLRENPNERYQSAAAVADELRAMRNYRLPSRRTWVGVLAVMLLSCVGLGLWWKSRPAVLPPIAPVADTKERILFLLPPDFWAPEYYPLRPVLEDHGYQVVIASTTMNPLRARSATRDPADKPVLPDLLIKDARAGDYLAVIVPGGNSKVLRPGGPGATDTARILNDMAAQKKWVGGIGSGVLVLGSAGVLKDREVACQPDFIDELRKLGAKPKSVPLRVDPPVTTARSGSDNDAFVETLLKKHGKGE